MSDWHEIWLREKATGIFRKAMIRPRGKGWTKCDHPDHMKENKVAAYLPRMWVEHPDGRVTEGSHGKPPRLFYCMLHGWDLYEEVVEEVPEYPTWDCDTCDNDLNDGRPFKWTPGNKKAELRRCSLCQIHGPKSGWPVDFPYCIENKKHLRV